ncbi:hypothetical protein AVEN_27442-1 [Araneus ventricosus]|uniref:Uncharacterized protein n=1 Tax=Araneus ventricosus TaxID=182803 RepID=A0A4Y2EJM7_ARAVE|nr:hypothetical protein AVEN_27442-1 [Araneus ventricosus]
MKFGIGMGSWWPSGNVTALRPEASRPKTLFHQNSAVQREAAGMISTCFRHGGFVRTKQEDNSNVIEKPTDLPEGAYEACINVDANLETAEKLQKKQSVKHG